MYLEAVNQEIYLFEEADNLMHLWKIYFGRENLLRFPMPLGRQASKQTTKQDKDK